MTYLPGYREYGLCTGGHQLKVTQDVFWACARDGTLPDRGIPAAPSGALPADLVHLLITRVGLAEAEIRQLSKPEAMARLQQYWTQGTLTRRGR